ncbi:FAD:protein FMN transferase [Mogibacterium neglectum]|uniref:FAD:protein FMN transferase n=1 Tax=Mogibacterium neglectum TaxID=114528 RepID=UPI002729CA78|nr:FAD:protein FMN transferase [Mogibacterium neglectum]WLD76107.1 FAD:protein FMN transferase [Mogibacterium neglectum]
MIKISKQTIKLSLIFIIIATVIITQTACKNTKDVEPVSKEGFYLDTACKISIYDMDGDLDKEKAEAAIDKAYKRCRELENTLSNTIESSEVSQINNAGGKWVTVGKDTLKVVKAGVKYGELSDGDFDITIGSVSGLWDFQAENPAVPDQSKITEALKHVNYKNIQFDGNKIRIIDPEAKLDLGGIAKGYVADELTTLLEKEGVTSAVINLGGNISTIGGKPDGSPFIIGIEKPYTDRTEIIGTTTADNQTVVTSGIYERQFQKDGKIYHHVLSSKTGYPVETQLEAVSLVAKKGRSMDIDAMSTICLMKGVDGGKAFIKKQKGVEAVFSAQGKEVAKTKGMKFTAE